MPSLGPVSGLPLSSVFGEPSVLIIGQNKSKRFAALPFDAPWPLLAGTFRRSRVPPSGLNAAAVIPPHRQVKPVPHPHPEGRFLRARVPPSGLTPNQIVPSRKSVPVYPCVDVLLGRFWRSRVPMPGLDARFIAPPHMMMSPIPFPVPPGRMRRAKTPGTGRSSLPFPMPHRSIPVYPCVEVLRGRFWRKAWHTGDFPDVPICPDTRRRPDESDIDTPRLAGDELFDLQLGRPDESETDEPRIPGDLADLQRSNVDEAADSFPRLRDDGGTGDQRGGVDETTGTDTRDMADETRYQQRGGLEQDVVSVFGSPAAEEDQQRTVPEESQVDQPRGRPDECS